MSTSATLKVPESIVTPTVRNGVSRSSESHKYTLEEYFALEAASEIRYEYDEGELIPMAGTSFEHNQIAGNFYTAFDRAFEGNDCRVFMEAIRFRVSPMKYRYPDVMALCEEPLTDGRKPPALLNPSIVVEVLSESTKNTDKGKKIEEYLDLPSVTDYLLVDQEQVSVVHWSRQGERSWNMNKYVDFADTVTLASVGVEITLKQIHRKINFANPESSPS